MFGQTEAWEKLLINKRSKTSLRLWDTLLLWRLSLSIYNQNFHQSPCRLYLILKKKKFLFWKWLFQLWFFFSNSYSRKGLLPLLSTILLPQTLCCKPNSSKWAGSLADPACISFKASYAPGNTQIKVNITPFYRHLYSFNLYEQLNLTFFASESLKGASLNLVRSGEEAFKISFAELSLIPHPTWQL